MEINLNPDTESQLQNLAATQGKAPAEVVEEAVTRMLQRQASFVAGVQRGIDAATRGDVIGHDEVVARMNQLLQP